MVIKGYHSNDVFEFNPQKICKYVIDKFLGLYKKRFHSELLDIYQKQENITN